MSFFRRIAGQAVTTANATFGAALPAGQTARLTQVKITQTGAHDAKVIVLAIGTTATAANVIGQYSLAAGVANVLEFPGIPIVAGEQLNVTQVGGTTAQAIIEAGLAVDLIA